MKDLLRINDFFHKLKKKGRTGRAWTRTASTPCLAINHGEFKILVVGAQGVGKTMICQKYVGLEKDEDDIAIKNDEIPYDTKAFINLNDEFQQYDVELFDVNDNLPAPEYKRYFEKADGFALVYSKNSEQSLLRLTQILSDIRLVKSSEPPLIILCNKADLKCKEPKNVLVPNIDKFDVCAVRNDGLQKAFNILFRKCAQRKQEGES